MAGAVRVKPVFVDSIYDLETYMPENIHAGDKDRRGRLMTPYEAFREWIVRIQRYGLPSRVARSYCVFYHASDDQLDSGLPVHASGVYRAGGR